jgi:sugar-specific transcriptional regulator TrmB
MELEILTKFGLTPVEAKIYLEIFKLGSSQIGPIIKRTSLHRGTVYNSINNLLEKGFLCFTNSDGIKYYRVCDNRVFDEYIVKRQKELTDNKKNLTRLLSRLNKMHEGTTKQDVTVYHGVDAFKNLFLEIYDECKKNGKEYLFQGRGGEMQKVVGENFYRYTQRLKKKMKVKCRVILSKETKNLPYHKYTEGNIRYLTTEIYSPINLWIYGDTVLIVLFGAVPLTSIKIKSDNLALGFINYFEYLWKIAKS